MNPIDLLEEPITDLPFPLASFPPAIAAWLEDTAIQARVPVAFVAFPFLACTGALLGNRISLQVSPGWTERPALWVALVAPSGHGKTPAIAAARAPFLPLHTGSTLLETLLDDYLAEEERYRALGQEPPPEDTANLTDADYDFEKLTVPSPLFISTTRIDLLTRALANATGLCLLRDELASLIHTVDRGRGEDHQILRSLWSSEPVYSHDPDLGPALDPVLGIVGGFQPILFEHLPRGTQDGLLERFLLVYPDARPGPRPAPGQPVPDPEPITAILEPLRPIDRATVIPTSEASATWDDWFQRNHAEINAAGPTLESFYRKMPSHTARIALILHALWDPRHPDRPLPEITVRRAIALAEYLRPLSQRVAATLGDRANRRSPVESLAHRTLAVLAIESDWLARTQLLQRLGRPETARFNRAIHWLTEREAIETTRERVDGSNKPVTFYRPTSRQNATNAGAR